MASNFFNRLWNRKRSYPHHIKSDYESIMDSLVGFLVISFAVNTIFYIFHRIYTCSPSYQDVTLRGYLKGSGLSAVGPLAIVVILVGLVGVLYMTLSPYGFLMALLVLVALLLVVYRREISRSL